MFSLGMEFGMALGTGLYGVKAELFHERERVGRLDTAYHSICNEQ